MSREELKTAFREVVSSEFDYIPTDENSIDFTFSEKFIMQMDKLILKQRKSYYKFVNTLGKRAAVIFVAIITLFAASLSVKAIREPVVKFIKQVYESFVHYSYSGDKTEKITKEYTIKLPDGFKQTNETKNKSLISIEYTNDLGYVIEFSQMTTEYSTGYFVDNENGNIETKIVNGIEIEFKERYNTKSAIWAQNGYVFIIDCYGNISDDMIRQIIESLK